MSWRVARSLDVLLGEINAAAPKRSKISDGSIGDAAHATRSSDHNPWVTLGGQGIVRARDFTHDPRNGLDCNKLAERLAALLAVGGHPALRSGAYIIWNRRIMSFDRRGEGWRYYSGSNPHDKHLHVSVTTDPHGFDNSAQWGVMVDRETLPDRAPKLLKISLSNVREQFIAARDGKSVKSLPGVKRIQRRLNRLYKAGLEVDGYVGRATLNAYGRHERATCGVGGSRIPDRHSLAALCKGSIYRVVK